MTKRMFIARKISIYVTSFLALGLFGQNCSNGFAPVEYFDHFASNGVSSTAEFMAAKAILKNNCTSCHSGSGSQFNAPLNLPSENQFILSGMVVPGKPDESKLIMRLKNSGSSPANSMPPNGNLSDADFQTLRRWILALGAAPATTNPFACNATDSLDNKVIASPVQLLSNLQYRNTIRDFLTLTTSDPNTVLSTAVDTVAIPSSSPARYERTVADLSKEKVAAFFKIADNVANQLSSASNAPAFLTSIINLNRGTCAGESLSSLSDACTKQLIRNLGLRLYRRPLIENGIAAEDEISIFMQEFSLEPNKSQAINNLVLRMMMSQNFLFRMEDSGVTSPTNAQLVQLSSFALANRLSYSFWNTMPDETLLRMAQDANLQQDLDFIRAMNYVLGSSRLNSSLNEFAYGWLLLKKTPSFDPATASLNFFNDGIRFDLSMREAMNAEAQDLFSYVTANNGTFADLFTTDVSFTRNSELMKVYGVAAAPNPTTPTSLVRMPSGTRSGILTRAALLSEASGGQNLIHRAVRIKRDLLCISQSPPPANTTPPTVMTDAEYESFTFRQRTAHDTGSGTCFTCHQSINPWGYPFSKYNGLGMFKLNEPAFTKAGTLTGSQLPTDSTSDLTGLVSDGSGVTDAKQFSEFISTRPEARSCFTSNYATYFLGRDPSSDKEGCRLNKMYNIIQSSGTLKDVMSSIATDIEFRHRKLD